jgi:polysaccharide biosynthesis protein PslG
MLRRTLLGVLAALSVMAATLVLPHGSAAATTPSGPAFGSQFHGMWGSYSDTQRAQVLDQLAAHGTEWVRLDVSWGMLQPDGPDRYSTWGVNFVDRVIGMITARGMKPLVTLWMTPAWANGGKGERALPDDPRHYAEAARWAAARWADKVPAWEVWNEPNDNHFMTGADPVAYGRLLKAAYPAFKAGNPSAKVLFGGPMYNDVDWIRRAYDAGARGSFDVMATHPYMGVADREPEFYDGTKWTLRHARAVHELMVANGDGHKPIWFTEFGWSSHPNTGNEANWTRGVTLAQQADYLVRTLELVARDMPYVTNVFWYAERDRTDSNVQINNYGLLHTDLRPKPVLVAARDYLAARAATAPAPAPAPAPTAPAPEPTAPAPEPTGTTTEPVTSPDYEVISCPATTSSSKAKAVLCTARTLTR